MCIAGSERIVGNPEPINMIEKSPLVRPGAGPRRRTQHETVVAQIAISPESIRWRLCRRSKTHSCEMPEANRQPDARDFLKPAR